MDLGLAGKTAFIGGSSDGLGKSVALELAREGANVIICGRSQEKLNNAIKEISEATQMEPLAIVGDLSIKEDRKNIIKTSLDTYEKVDIVVTNTGGPPPGLFEDLSNNQWDDTYQLLLASAVDLVQGFLPGMKKQKWGRIISITSMAVKQPVANLILSNSVRASVVGLMKTLAMELGPYNITVNNVMPGYTETARLQSLRENNPSFSEAIKEVPLGRTASPEEFAAAVAFLASTRASYITGISLPVDGGWIKSVM